MRPSSRIISEPDESQDIKDLKNFEGDVTKGLRRIVTAAEARQAQLAELLRAAAERDAALIEAERNAKAITKKAQEAEQRSADLEQQVRQANDQNRRILDRQAAVEAQETALKQRAEKLEQENAQLTDRCENAQMKAEEVRRQAMAVITGGSDVFDGSLGRSTGGGAAGNFFNVPASLGSIGSHEVYNLNGGHANGEDRIDAVRATGLGATPMTPNIFVATQDLAGNTFAPGQGLTCTPEYLHAAVLAYNGRLGELKQAVGAANSANSDVENFERLGKALKAYVDESRRTMLAMSCIPPGSDLHQYDELQAKGRQLLEETAKVARAVGLQGSVTGPEIDQHRRVALNMVDHCQLTANDALRLAELFLPKGKEFNPDDVATLLSEEMRQMQAAVSGAIAKLEDIQNKAQKTQKEAWKLEVDDRILAACKQLARAIQEITEAAASLQQEIEKSEKGSLSTGEFYKRNARWAQGLISSAKEITHASIGFVKAADEAITEGKFEEVIVWTEEVSAATIRLAVTSRVKAPRNSRALPEVMAGTKSVRVATEAVVLQVRQSLEIVKQKEAQQHQAYEKYVETLNFYETNKLEMESKIAAKRLEAELEREQQKLRTLRKRHAKLAGPDEARRLAQNDQDFSRKPGGQINSASGFAKQVLSAGPNQTVAFFPPDENDIGTITATTKAPVGSYY